MTEVPRSTEPVPHSGDGLVRVRLDLGYDGTDFSGWAKQPGRRTVQGAFEDAIATVFGLSSAAQLTVAGRTDAGVHARGQVAHVDLPIEAWEAKRDAAIRQLRGLLPADVRLVALGVAPTGFDARFSAISRSYTYRISDAPAGVDPLRRRDVVWHKKGLDAAAMNRAAAALLGEHDFAAFCKRREGASTIRTLTQFSWQREEDDLLTASVVADAFCHNMVRSLVGACIPVGEGRRDMSWVSATLGGAERSSEVTVMPAHGLTLEEITYPTHADLARRAREARTFRVLK